MVFLPVVWSGRPSSFNVTGISVLNLFHYRGDGIQFVNGESSASMRDFELINPETSCSCDLPCCALDQVLSNHRFDRLRAIASRWIVKGSLWRGRSENWRKR